jgi:hypothetical protein
MGLNRLASKKERIRMDQNGQRIRPRKIAEIQKIKRK